MWLDFIVTELWASSSVAEQGTFNPCVVGPIPTWPTIRCLLTMPEEIQTYALGDLEAMTPMDRAAFYDEQLALDTPTRAIEVVNILLFNEHGEVILQKRSKSKRHNPGLIDKSIGGHITHGNTADYTVLTETVQELQVPSMVLRDGHDFTKTYALLGSYLDTIALIRYIDTSLHLLTKVFDTQERTIANKLHLYLGVYSGRVKNVDREAQGLLTYSLAQLQSELDDYPKLFTHDLRMIVTKYAEQIESFRALIIQAR